MRAPRPSIGGGLLTARDDMRLRELLRHGGERREGTREPGEDLLGQGRDVLLVAAARGGPAVRHRTLARDNDERCRRSDALGLDERTARIARD